MILSLKILKAVHFWNNRHPDFFLIPLPPWINGHWLPGMVLSLKLGTLRVFQTSEILKTSLQSFLLWKSTEFWHFLNHLSAQVIWVLLLVEIEAKEYFTGLASLDKLHLVWSPVWYFQLHQKTYTRAQKSTYSWLLVSRFLLPFLSPLC